MASQRKIACRVDVLDDEAFEGPMRYRWECTCRRVGAWTVNQETARRNGQQHVQRSTPKPSGPPALRKLLALR